MGNFLKARKKFLKTIKYLKIVTNKFKKFKIKIDWGKLKKFEKYRNLETCTKKIWSIAVMFKNSLETRKQT